MDGRFDLLLGHELYQVRLMSKVLQPSINYCPKVMENRCEQLPPLRSAHLFIRFAVGAYQIMLERVRVDVFWRRPFDRMGNLMHVVSVHAAKGSPC